MPQILGFNDDGLVKSLLLTKSPSYETINDGEGPEIKLTSSSAQFLNPSLIHHFFRLLPRIRCECQTDSPQSGKLLFVLAKNCQIHQARMAPWGVPTRDKAFNNNMLLQNNVILSLGMSLATFFTYQTIQKENACLQRNWFETSSGPWTNTIVSKRRKR